MWMSGAGGSGCCNTGMPGCGMCCSPPGPWDPVTLSKEGANSDAAAFIVEREEQHGENVGVKGAIVFCEKKKGNTLA